MTDNTLQKIYYPKAMHFFYDWNVNRKTMSQTLIGTLVQREIKTDINLDIG
jgi:hypothetical protein